MLTRYCESSPLPKIDSRARKILAYLAMDGRQTDTQIAKRVRLSREAVHYRISRLSEQGVLQSISPMVNLPALGWSRFHFFLLVDERHKRTSELFSWLKKHPNTLSVMEFTDTWDVRWELIAKSMQEYDGIARELQNTFSDILIEKQELAVITEYEASGLPICFEPSILQPRQSAKGASASIDNYDVKVLRALSADGRASSCQIAPQVGLSNDAILLRLKRLRETQIISRYTAICNLSSLGFHWYTLAVQFSRFTIQDEQQLKEFVRHNQYIMQAERTFGQWDVIIEIVADPAAFHKTVKEMKSAFAGFIKKYETWVAYKEHTYRPVPQVVVHIT